MTRAEVVARVVALGTTLVEVTGGEPLLQPGVVPLLSELCDLPRTVLLETSGEADVAPVDTRVHKVMDLKCPGSGESHRNRWTNLEHIGPRDEIKFVVADRLDYEWMRTTIRDKRLTDRTRALLASAVFGRLAPRDLARWVLEDSVPVRVQLQLHKYIWGPDATGV
jgi:7-carboxy-7-deazaguanine synthase